MAAKSGAEIGRRPCVPRLGGTARVPQDLARLSELGLDFAEVSIREPEAFGPLAEGFRAARSETGFELLCHGPEEGDPNDLQQLAARYFPKLVRVLNWLGPLEARLLTVHLWMDARFVKGHIRKRKLELVQDFVKRASAAGANICLENLSERAEDFAELLECVPDLGLTLDVGHAELLSAENRSHELIAAYGPRIRHVHFHDNLGGNSPADDLHLPVGEGAIRFAPIVERLRDAGYQATISLELRPAEIGRCLPRMRELLALYREASPAAGPGGGSTARTG